MGSKLQVPKTSQGESDFSRLQALSPLPRRDPLWIFCANVCPSVVPQLLLFIIAGNGLVWTLFPVFEGQSVG